MIEKTDDPKGPADDSKASPTWNERLSDNGYALALVTGIVMLILGAALAFNKTPEAAFVWTGAILILIGVVGDRLRSAEFGPSGGKVTLDERRRKVTEVLREAPRVSEPMATIELPPQVVEPMVAYGRPPFTTGDEGGVYWSSTVLDQATLAAGSNSRREFEQALRDLEKTVSREGPMIVMVTHDEDAPDTLKQ